MRTDPDYRYKQKMSNKKWAQRNPDYWTRYSQKNPKKAERYRLLQAVHNRRQDRNNVEHPHLIAKVDASKPKHINLIGQILNVRSNRKQLTCLLWRKIARRFFAEAVLSVTGANSLFFVSHFRSA
jgi:hypothetical protein